MSAVQRKLTIYCIYNGPKDYPGKYVVREWFTYEGDCGSTPAPEPMAVVDTLEEARMSIPQDTVRFDPDKNDDPCIEETWL